MKFIIPREFSTEISISRKFYILDLLILIGAFILTVSLDFLVVPKLQPFYYAFSAIVWFYLVLKSSTNKGKRNYEAIYMAIMRNPCTYHIIDEEGK
ncbi:conserved hypothetical protein [Clostridium perfringens D str. JGS1721]|uniref:TcpE family n=1 Tax=Clostridium perfringens D str. JGS1721 TaxID=488537 RepID=B1V531_CLOPF|nr:DUF5592 family protein [Clostridium perfringens]EDT70102.1 conserved hypothetical protein [Clostridium perfringens D str. JGS1721]EDT70291.1 conserved hypothetical protein [Clostridium perfringens D str. JGS1721]EDT70569.1 conserved hypothetical protein [Clostridium perfringens D str. JGS1721]EDT71062.1 conserved hypothetical protein [Clostridium perfringens D str. JGS1721]